MNESTWENAKITPVLIKTGVFSNEQSIKFRPASFDIVSMNGVTYINTVGFACNALDAASSDTGIDNYQMRQGWGFMQSPISIEDGQMGAADDDTLIALHALGNV